MGIEHAIQRAKERYGIDLLPEDIIEITKMCYRRQPNTKQLFVRGLSGLLKQYPRNKLFRVKYKEHTLDVAIIVDKYSKRWYLLTFLPKPTRLDDYWVYSPVVDQIMKERQ